VLRALASCALAVAVASAPELASAQQVAAPAPADEPLEVVVRGGTAGGYASRTTAGESPREPIDAASLLAELPSVHVRRLGPEGSFAALSVRGSASTQVGVVLAGVPLTSAADPSLDVGSLPLWPGARMKVYRGFAPASVGTSGYLGGVLVVDPPSIVAGGARTESWLAAGSFGALKARIGDARRVGDVSFGTGLYASRSDGDFSYEVADPVTNAVRARVRTNAGYASAGGIERVSWDRPWGSLGATVLVESRAQGLAGTILRPTTLATLETSRVLGGLDARLRTSEGGAVHLAAWGRREGSAVDDPRGELDPTSSRLPVRQAIVAAGGSAGWRGRVGPAGEDGARPLLVDLFVDGRGERFEPDAASGAAAAPAGRVAGGLGCELEWRATARLTLAASCRIDVRRDDATGATGPGGVPLGVSADLAPSGHVGASYRFDDAAVVSVHGGALERPPSFVELYGNRGTLLGDPSLRPERALSADLGLHGDVLAGGAALGYEVVGFVTSARDLIAFVPLGLGTFRARNLDRAALAGAEVSGALSARGLRTTVSYTLLFTENLGDDPLARGRPLPGRPLHDLAYDAAYQLAFVRLRYGLDAVAGSTVDPAGTLVLPPRLLHGAGASVDVPGVPGLRVGVEVENLFDLRTLYVDSPLSGRPVAVPVSDFLGFPLPGRTFWGTVRYAID
jgi:iron complex outermembrane receptor protein